MDVASVDEDDRAEPVPLGLVDPLVARRQFLRRPGELREEGWLEGEQRLEDVATLGEAGPILGTVLDRGDVDRPQHRRSGCDEKENGHEYIFGPSAPLL
jgi:hypothetical protein